MKKIDKHEPYCGCINCKPIDTTEIISRSGYGKASSLGLPLATFTRLPILISLKPDWPPLNVTDPSTEDTGEWPVLKPEPHTRPEDKPDGAGNK